MGEETDGVCNVFACLVWDIVTCGAEWSGSQPTSYHHTSICQANAA